MPGSTVHVTMYVEVPDIAEALAGVDELGRTSPWSRFPTSHDTALGWFADPERHLIGLISTIGYPIPAGPSPQTIPAIEQLKEKPHDHDERNKGRYVD